MQSANTLTSQQHNLAKFTLYVFITDTNLYYV